MSTIARVRLAEAEHEAAAFRQLFFQCHVRWEVAGSIRRRKADIGDVEHVVIPRMGEPVLDLFQQAVGEAKTLMRRKIDELLDAGTVTLHRYGESQTTRNGERYVGLDYRGRLHELFMCWEENWGCILTIRTGSGEFSKALVTRLRRHGYRQHEGGLFKRNESGCVTGRLIENEWYRDVACPDEATFFAAAGLNMADWPPERRTDEEAGKL